ncbi:MAG TPA: hypothetical protein VM536_09570, partial [Chloroflexia bacterium]|nr:hypothetical protein [Chloroflexia bacterium]
MSSGTAAKSGPAFAGTTEQQELAAKAFDLMRRQGMLFAADAPIVVALDRLVQGLSRSFPKIPAAKLADQVTAALDANTAVFARQETGGIVSYQTSKSGQARFVDDQSRHMFRQRLNGAASAVTEEESRSLTEGWIAQAATRSESFSIFQEPAAEAAVAGRWQSPGDVAAYVAPTHPVPGGPDLGDFGTPEDSPFAAFQGYSFPPAPPMPELPSFDIPTLLPAGETNIADFSASPVLDVPAEPAAPVAEVPVVEAPEPAPVPVAPPRPAPVVVPPAPPAPPRPVRYSIDTADGPVVIDLTTSHDDILAAHGAQMEAMLEQAVRDDFRFASFGGDWYPEDHVERFSKGDFRRVKDYLIETQEALS